MDMPRASIADKRQSHICLSACVDNNTIQYRNNQCTKWLPASLAHYTVFWSICNYAAKQSGDLSAEFRIFSELYRNDWADQAGVWNGQSSYIMLQATLYTRLRHFARKRDLRYYGNSRLCGFFGFFCASRSCDTVKLFFD